MKTLKGSAGYAMGCGENEAVINERSAASAPGFGEIAYPGVFLVFVEISGDDGALIKIYRRCACCEEPESQSSWHIRSKIAKHGP
jgi:hypothetical protein